MQARIYFAVVIATSVAVGTYMESTIEALTVERDNLEESLLTQNQIIESLRGHILRDRAGTTGKEPEQAESATPEPAVTLQLDLGRQLELMNKISTAERRVERYRREAVGYQMMIDALKDEITVKDAELSRVREALSRYSAAHERHVEGLGERARDLERAIEEFRSRQEEYSSLRNKVGKMSTEVRLAEAEACYARAQLAEAEANRIFFSRERKKQYLNEALEGYRKAESLGKDEASQNVQRLEKSLLSSVASLN